MAACADPLRLHSPTSTTGHDASTTKAAPTETAAATEHNATVEYGHSLGDLVTVAVQAGLVIEHLASTGLSSLPFGRRLLDDGLQRWRCNG